MATSMLAKIFRLNSRSFTCLFVQQRAVKWLRSGTRHMSGAVGGQQGGSSVKLNEGEDEFRVYQIPGLKPVERQKRRQAARKEVAPPRFLKMKTDQDWTSVWPTANAFKWSSIPFPVRQGFIQNMGENDGVIPGKYANAELMKIPNFLHLTPAHIKKHCAALKEFCTEWPEGLETDEDVMQHFPVEVITSDFCFSGSSLRDPRGRVVKIKLKLSDLELDYHARNKLLRLVGDRYDRETDMLTITTDRCPVKKQNYDYAMYLLTACFFESWKTEPWEADKEEADWEKYYWDKSNSRKSIVELVQKISQNEKFLPEIPQNASEEQIVNAESIQNYGKAVANLHNDGEDEYTVKNYKESVLKLFNMTTLRT